MRKKFLYSKSVFKKTKRTLNEFGEVKSLLYRINHTRLTWITVASFWLATPKGSAKHNFVCTMKCYHVCAYTSLFSQCVYMRNDKYKLKKNKSLWFAGCQKRDFFKRDFVAKINDNEYLVCEYYSSLQHTWLFSRIFSRYLLKTNLYLSLNCRSTSKRYIKAVPTCTV